VITKTGRRRSSWPLTLLHCWRRDGGHFPQRKSIGLGTGAPYPVGSSTGHAILRYGCSVFYAITSAWTACPRGLVESSVSGAFEFQCRSSFGSTGRPRTALFGISVSMRLGSHCLILSRSWWPFSANLPMASHMTAQTSTCGCTDRPTRPRSSSSLSSWWMTSIHCTYNTARDARLRAFWRVTLSGGYLGVLGRSLVRIGSCRSAQRRMRARTRVGMGDDPSSLRLSVTKTRGSTTFSRGVLGVSMILTSCTTRLCT